MNGTCIGGLETITFFESIAGLIPEHDRETYERAMNRIRYEAAKGIGVRTKTTKAVYKWHKDLERCGNCGFGGVQANHEYCPNCGTKYLRNPYTEKKVKEFEHNHQITLEEILEGGVA